MGLTFCHLTKRIITCSLS